MDQYAGNPNSYPLTVGIVDDSDEWSADNLGVASEGTLDRTAYLFSRSSVGGLNWPRGLSAWTGAQVAQPNGAFASLLCAPVWDPAYGRWLVCASEAGSIQCVLQSYDGYAWSDFWILPTGISGSVFLYGVVVRPSDGRVLVISPDAAFGTISAYLIAAVGSGGGGGADLVPTTGGPWGTTAPTAPHSFSGVHFSIGTPVWVVWEGGSTAAPAFMPSTGTAWSVATTWAPAGTFTVHDRAHIAAPTQILIFPSDAAPTQYMLTTDGQNWTPTALPALAAGELIIDATYDTLSGLYYFLTSTGSAGRLWQSPSGLTGTWTVVSTIAHRCYALKANGPELLVWTSFGSNTDLAVTYYRAIASTDAGAHWRVTQMVTTTAPGNYFALRASGSQFMYVNAAEYAASQVVGPTSQLVV